MTRRGGLRAADEPGGTASRPGGHPVVVRAPGKVNLALQVSPLGDDGYHRVLSVFQAVSLVEEVEASPAEGLSLTVTGPQADLVPTDDTNIAWRRTARGRACRGGPGRAPAPAQGGPGRGWHGGRFG